MSDEIQLIDIIDKFIAGDWGEETATEESPCAVSCIRGADIVPIANSRFDSIPVRFISVASIKNRELQEGDIVIEKSGGSPTQSTGRTAFISKKLVESKKHIVCSNFCQAFRLKSGWNPLYVYYFLQVVYNSGVFFNFEGKTSGLRNLILDSAFKSIMIRKVPLLEQERVAKTISLIDEKISTSVAINDNLEALARQLFDYWFVQFDFTDKDGNPYKSSGGKMVWDERIKRSVPVSWKVGKLDDYIEQQVSGDWGEDCSGKDLIAVSCIRGADLKTLEHLPVRFIPNSHLDRLLNDGDIVVEMSGGSPTQSTGRAALVTSNTISDNDGLLICSNFCRGLRIKEPYQYYFFFLWQMLYDNGNMFNFEGNTSGLRNLQLDSLCSAYWYFPNESSICLSEFNSLIKSYLQERDNSRQIIRSLKEQRDALLPLIISGQVTVTSSSNY